MKKILISIYLFTLLAVNVAQAEPSNLSNAFGSDSYLNTIAGKAGFDTSAEKSNLNNMFGTIVQVILSLLGIFFLGLMIYAGFLWMTDRGNSDQVEKSKKLMSAAIIGMAIVVGSYAISYFVINAISTPVLK